MISLLLKQTNYSSFLELCQVNSLDLRCCTSVFSELGIDGIHSEEVALQTFRCGATMKKQCVYVSSVTLVFIKYKKNVDF